jgi:hypothetical protein
VDEGLKLVQSVETNTKHYVEIISRAVDKAMPQPGSDVKYGTTFALPGCIYSQGRVASRTTCSMS